MKARKTKLQLETDSTAPDRLKGVVTTRIVRTIDYPELDAELVQMVATERQRRSKRGLKKIE